MRKGGLEPPHLSVPDPKSGASANSATFALTPKQFSVAANENITCICLRHKAESSVLVEWRSSGVAFYSSSADLQVRKGTLSPLLRGKQESFRQTTQFILTSKGASSHGSQVNLNLPGALHNITSNCRDRTPVSLTRSAAKVFLDELQKLNRSWPNKLITYVLMPGHLQLIANPRDGRIKEFIDRLKAVSARAIVRATSRFVFSETDKGHQVWQESFKDVALWVGG